MKPKCECIIKLSDDNVFWFGWCRDQDALECIEAALDDLGVRHWRAMVTPTWALGWEMRQEVEAIRAAGIQTMAIPMLPALAGTIDSLDQLYSMFPDFEVQE